MPIKQLQCVVEEAPLLPSFAVAMLSAGAIVSDRWRVAALWPTMVLLALSTFISVIFIRRLLAQLSVRYIQKLGAELHGEKALVEIADATHLIVDGVDLLRHGPRQIAPYQPRCDAKIQPLLRALVDHGSHPLCLLARDNFDRLGVKPDPVSDAFAGPGGGVSAVWRGHRVTLYAPALRQGDWQMSLCLSLDGDVAALLYFEEALAGDCGAWVHQLRESGLEVVIADEDAPDMLICVAQQLGIPLQGEAHGRKWAAELAAETVAPARRILLLSGSGYGEQFSLQRAGEQRLIMAASSASVIVAARRAAVRFRYAAQHSLSMIAGTHILALGGFFAGAGMVAAVLGALAGTGLTALLLSAAMLRTKPQADAPMQDHIEKYITV